MSSKEKYRALCDREESIPIFSRDWWLDTVCGPDHWEALLAERNGQIQAAMPLYIPTRGIVSMPSYTQTMGPWIKSAPADTKYTTELGRRQAICQQFAEELRRYPRFLQNFAYDITDWLPFYWAGYKQTTRYTYLLNHITDETEVWRNMNPNIRRNILKARDKLRLSIRRGIPVRQLLEIQEYTFKRQHLRNKSDTHVLERLVDICRKRGQGDIWGGYDQEGHLHAAAFVVWQPRSAYYIAGGGDPAYRASGAQSLVLWEAICHASSFTDRFDFEGSMLPGVERFFRGFGAIQTPYFTISKGKLSLLDRARMKLSKWI